MESPREKWMLIVCNLALKQVDLRIIPCSYYLDFNVHCFHIPVHLYYSNTVLQDIRVDL